MVHHRSPALLARHRLAALAALIAVVAPALAADEHPALALVERAAIAVRTDPEASRRDAEGALAILARRPDADLEIRARLVLCDYHSERDRSAAEAEISRATALLSRAQRHALRAGILVCQGETIESTGENARARALYEQAVGVASDAHDEEMLAGALFSRGYVLGLQGEYASGLADLRRSQTLYEKLAMPHHSLTALNGIAILYNRMGDHAHARDIYARALEAQTEAGMRREQVVTQHNLGRAHENLHEWDAARRAFTASYELSRELAYPRGEAYALRGLAAVAVAVGDPRGALTTLARAEMLQRQTTDTRLGAQIELVRGIALHQLGRMNESVTALERAAEVFRKGDILQELAAATAELATLYADLGYWRLAFERQEESKATTERMLRNQIDQRFATLKVEFDTAAKDKENALLVRENEANSQLLEQAQRVRHLQATVIGLTTLLAVLLATLAVFQRHSTLRMRELAMTDELTGAPNRRAVLGRLELLLRNADAPPCSILIVDIDHFKSVNDRHGHHAGDEVLKVISDTIRSSVREPAFVGRLGGEEFLIVLPATALDEARQAAERFREQLTTIVSPWLTDPRHVTASIGVTTSSPAADSPSSMLQRADAALYAAKRGGRNCVKTEPAPVTVLAQRLADRQAG
ncbi:MAG: diguanylate cyclase domain-containing protein [Steroidobacteraceae bacterium]